jgi:hypothetical protein
LSEQNRVLCVCLLSRAQDDLPAVHEQTLRNFGKMCIGALIQDKFYFTRDEIIKVLPESIRYLLLINSGQRPLKKIDIS